MMAMLAVVPAMAADLEQIVVEAKKAQLEARELNGMLKQRSVDGQRVAVKLQYLSEHSAKLDELIGSFAAANPDMAPSVAAEFKRMRDAAEGIAIFVANKHNLLAADGLSKQKSLLRAKADGVAKRAEMVQQSALRIRS